jgi:RNA polymerase sigma factor (sigma-70 family)
MCKIAGAAATILLVMTEQPPPPTPDGPGCRPGHDGPAVDWAAALAAHDRWLRTAVLARLGERQAVDEVMQEVALAAVAQRAPLGDPSKLGAWLYRLAVRQTLLHRRKCGRRHRIDGRYAAMRGKAGGAAPAPDPLDWLVQVERRHMVRAALETLTRRDAEILLLKYTEGWSYRELAGRLGVGESAVEARLHRARQRLREALAGVCVNEESE